MIDVQEIPNGSTELATSLSRNAGGCSATRSFTTAATALVLSNQAEGDTAARRLAPVSEHRHQRAKTSSPARWA